MTTKWKYDNHEIELVDPDNSLTWLVIRGTKSVSEIIKQNLEEPREYKTKSGTDLSNAELTALQTTYRTGYEDDTIVLNRLIINI